MELEDAIVRRRMRRSFKPDPLPRADLDRVLDLARRAPSAGNTQASGFVVLDSPTATAAYWDVTLPPDRRSSFRWQGLLRAPALVLVTTSAAQYVNRYGEPDKSATGLGESSEAWPVPYWWVDAGAVVQNLLLLAADRGWAACLFGPFDHEPALIERFGLDPERRLVATIALGWADDEDEPGRSAGRTRPNLDTVLIRPGSG